MIYSAQCLQNITIKSLGLVASKGQSFDLTKAQYDSNPEVQRLVATGSISLRVKSNQSPSKLGVHNPRFQVVRDSKVVKEVVEKVVEKPVIVEKIVEKEVVVEKEQPQLDMNQLASLLLQQLGTMISPEAIAQAVAQQLPTQQVMVNNQPQNGNMQTTFSTSDEELTFIPSNIISSTAKASSESLASETKSEGSAELSDALSALKALRKANKQ